MAKKSSKRPGIHPAILILFFILSVFSIWAFVNEITRKPCGISTPSGSPAKSTVSKTEISDCDKIKKILLKLADFQLYRTALKTKKQKKLFKDAFMVLSKKKCDSDLIKKRLETLRKKKKCNLDNMYKNSMKKLEFTDNKKITKQSHDRMGNIQNCLMIK